MGRRRFFVLDEHGRVPTLSIFYGIKIQMFWRDHPPPDFHATAEGRIVVIAIETPDVLEGSLNARQTRLAFQWAKLHQAELTEAWTQCSNMQQPQTITPLP